jgi:hypothetical protein
MKTTVAVLSGIDRRKLLRTYYTEVYRVIADRRAIELTAHEAWLRGNLLPSVLPRLVLPDLPPFPEILRGLACGAKTRAGTPCKITALYANGRCKLHGGLSTGPRTPEGKKRAALNGQAKKLKQRLRTP